MCHLSNYCSVQSSHTSVESQRLFHRLSSTCVDVFLFSAAAFMAQTLQPWGQTHLCRVPPPRPDVHVPAPPRRARSVTMLPRTPLSDGWEAGDLRPLTQEAASAGSTGGSQGESRPRGHTGMLYSAGEVRPGRTATGAQTGWNDDGEAVDRLGTDLGRYLVLKISLWGGSPFHSSAAIRQNRLHVVRARVQIVSDPCRK